MLHAMLRLYGTASAAVAVAAVAAAAAAVAAAAVAAGVRTGAETAEILRCDGQLIRKQLSMQPQTKATPPVPQ